MAIKSDDYPVFMFYNIFLNRLHIGVLVVQKRGRISVKIC